MNGDETEPAPPAADSTEIAERAENAAERAEVAAVVAQLADEEGDRGRVFDDEQLVGAQVAALNAGLAQLEQRLFRVEAVLARQGFKS